MMHAGIAYQRYPLKLVVGENVPGIPGACATCNFTYLARGPSRMGDINNTTVDHFLQVVLSSQTCPTDITLTNNHLDVMSSGSRQSYITVVVPDNALSLRLPCAIFSLKRGWVVTSPWYKPVVRNISWACYGKYYGMELNDHCKVDMPGVCQPSLVMEQRHISLSVSPCTWSVHCWGP